MKVLVPIEIPKSCFDCPFNAESLIGYFCELNKDITMDWFNVTKEKVENCPLNNYEVINDERKD